MQLNVWNLVYPAVFTPQSFDAARPEAKLLKHNLPQKKVLELASKLNVSENQS